VGPLKEASSELRGKGGRLRGLCFPVSPALAILETQLMQMYVEVAPERGLCHSPEPWWTWELI
jgi:hypothetical protein